VRAAETLYVAMDDPTNEPALIELAATTGLPVKAMVSSPSEIRHAIRVYYLGGAPQVHAPERRASRHPDALEATQAAQHTVVIPAAPPTGLSDHSIPANAQEWESGVAEAPNPEAAPRAAQPPAAVAAQPPAPPPAAVAAPPAAAPTPLSDSPGRRSYSDIEDEPVEASRPSEAVEASDGPAVPAVAASQPGSAMSNARSRMKALRSLALTPAQSGDDEALADGAAPAGVKMVTLTLLDGSTVRLPAPGSKRKDAHPSQAEGGLTASDLVSALLARAQGADVSDVLPDQQWEVLFASLLTLLIRKGLLADWEFVEEWKKRQGS
jgi:type IV pilus assembly protein PilB